jgi:hypothetical protein
MVCIYTIGQIGLGKYSPTHINCKSEKFLEMKSSVLHRVPESDSQYKVMMLKPK